MVVVVAVGCCRAIVAHWHAVTWPQVICKTNCVMFVSVVGVVISNSAFFGGTCI
jgi:hypothetical protein